MSKKLKTVLIVVLCGLIVLFGAYLIVKQVMGDRFSLAALLPCGNTVFTQKYEQPNIDVTYHEDLAQEVLDYLNSVRKTAGLGELSMDHGAMMDAAKARAKEITVYFAHERLNGDDNFTVFKEYGVSYRYAGENLASGQPSVASVFSSWWNSPDHKKNLMGEHYNRVSIVCMEYEGQMYWVQLFRD